MEHDLDYVKYFKEKNKKIREKKIREADKKALKCYDKYKNEDGYKQSRFGIWGKTKVENATPYLSTKIFGNYKGGCDKCLNGGCNSCEKCLNGGCNSCGNCDFRGSNISVYDLKYNICDGKYCFSFSEQNFPIAKLGNKFIFLNENEHGKNCEGKLIRANKNNFELIPDSNLQREVIYIAGPSRAGKTTFAKNYIKKYKKIYLNRKLFLFSRKLKDESIDDINPIRIKIDEEFLEEDKKLDYKMFKNSIIVFDDIENISSDKKIKKEVKKIHNDLLNLGGDQNITVINIVHNIMGGIETKNIIAESNKIVIFPNSGYQYINFLKIYLGIEQKESRRIIKNSDSRWLVFSRICPLYVMSEKKIMMINNKN
jgi:hypothetical protein